MGDDRIGLKTWLRRWFISAGIMTITTILLTVIPRPCNFKPYWQAALPLPTVINDCAIYALADPLALAMRFLFFMLLWHWLDIGHITVRRVAPARLESAGFVVFVLALCAEVALSFVAHADLLTFSPDFGPTPFQDAMDRLDMAITLLLFCCVIERLVRAGVVAFGRFKTRSMTPSRP
jgi:hypothetical protein